MVSGTVDVDVDNKAVGQGGRAGWQRLPRARQIPGFLPRRESGMPVIASYFLLALL